MSERAGEGALAARLDSHPSMSSERPSAKALGKRKMTLEQLHSFYAKQQRASSASDSETEEATRTSLVVPGNPVIAPEDEHARDLIEALGGTLGRGVVGIAVNSVDDLFN
jgi:hypothetical protein